MQHWIARAAFPSSFTFNKELLLCKSSSQSGKKGSLDTRSFRKCDQLAIWVQVYNQMNSREKGYHGGTVASIYLHKFSCLGPLDVLCYSHFHIQYRSMWSSSAQGKIQTTHFSKHTFQIGSSALPWIGGVYQNPSNYPIFQFKDYTHFNTKLVRWQAPCPTHPLKFWL